MFVKHINEKSKDQKDNLPKLISILNDKAAFLKSKNEKALL